jgi:rhodanese-related sulfurtransferase
MMINIGYIIAIVSLFIIAHVLFRRYNPFLQVPCICKEHLTKQKNLVILDVRDYNEESRARMPQALNIPYAYLPRFYHEIPNGSIHVIASKALDRNLAIQFLKKKGIDVKSYTLTNKMCDGTTK